MLIEIATKTSPASAAVAPADATNRSLHSESSATAKSMATFYQPSFGTTRIAPRISGWTRQKKVWVPTGRFFGVVQLVRSTVGAPPIPSWPESKRKLPSAIG